MDLGYGVSKKKNYKRTTYSVQSKYKNLIKGKKINSSNKIWQSDITYYQVENRFYYLVFIIDVYNKKIVGYNASKTLRADSNIKALKMAIKSVGGKTDGLIHHSDRGAQYIEKNYIKLLTFSNIKISMADKAQDNAYAERINGIIKNEYLEGKTINSFEELEKNLRKSVNHYNIHRLHKGLPLKWLTPFEFEEKMVKTQMKNRPILTIFDENNLKTNKYINNYQ